jgi:hypothetical protein
MDNKSIDTEHLRKCAVSGKNQNDDPDFFFCRVICDDGQFRRGLHRVRAELEAERHGYYELGPIYEPDSPAFFHLDALFKWESAEPLKIISTRKDLLESIQDKLHDVPETRAFVEGASIEDLLTVRDILGEINAEEGISVEDWELIQEAASDKGGEAVG